METMNININKMKEEYKDQMKAQTEKLTTDLASTIDDKLKPLFEENKVLKDKVETLNNKVRSLEKETRRNNIILHGIDETEENNNELQKLVIEAFSTVSTAAGSEPFDKWELSDVYRLGRKQEKKRRPILVKLTLAWRRTELLKNNKKFPLDTYVTEDFPKDVLNTRKELKAKMQEEIKKGNNAVIRYDRLIIRERSNATEKRKRSPTITPTKKDSDEEVPQKAPNKIYKTNAFDLMNHPRANSYQSTSERSEE
ncbi:uncharacterized protein LOC134742332 [Cydia strobilella]|uniref:uncharacterized protein LOC134742332 n=1 Tax=Cydia strobilella TaxID=1100964 RepID=UPI003006F74C